MNEFLASTMSQLAALFGGNMGWAIILLALTVRAALLPLTLHLARKMLANQKKIKTLQPQVDALKERLKDKPQHLLAEMSALYKANGAQMIDRSSILGALAQWPVFLLLYKAVSAASGRGVFLWIRNLAAPDVLLTGIVLAITAVAAYYAPAAAPETATLMMIIQVVVTALIIWQLSAGVGLYWAASATVGAVQSFILRFEQRRIAVAAP